jgi:hypothetical protein
MPCWLREELLRQPPVFGGDRQPAAVALAEIGGDVVEIGHGVDVEPDVGHGYDDIGMAEAETGAISRACLPVGEVFTDQVLAGDAEIDGALADLAWLSRKPTGRRPRHHPILRRGAVGAIVNGR